MTVRPIVLLAAIGLEYKALRAHLVEPQALIRAGTRYDVGHVMGAARQVVLAQVGPGNARTAALAEQARACFEPQAIIFVGVAGSLKADVKLGDVVVADKIYAYDGAKHVADAEFTRPGGWEPSHSLLQTARHALERTSAWTERITRGAPWPAQPAPEVHFKPVAAGESVLNSMSSRLRERLNHVYNDAVAVEMESAGLATAAVFGGFDMLTIRGISDHADGAKATADAGGRQQIAAAHAAAAAAAVIAALPASDGSPVPTREETEADESTSPRPGMKQINMADHNGVVNASQGGHQNITYGLSK
ncbi:5'-methylthioadenosine/S-adenosylhomocysteine nucleosidase [Streptomyces murinus]|uniref:5'-methylthioadenosine/S-adenosylhomocysteine nucleosidase family protein n=1 Tax=Streptomyces murinus TaxID=33900 RepID=UPI002E80EA8A|nr:5'-methylthioadenosine/S-adenosylhomocysteine nucleosidase [Streptomyces murinus]WUD06301.1 5'-methylthioadenosine/S-adenosylhomocysteine nucleosidase [Streptomyces murinus]